MGGMALASLAAAVGLAATVGGLGSTEERRVVAHPAPVGQPLNTTFSVRVRPVGGDWQRLDAYQAPVDRDTRSMAAMVLFEAEGPVEVEVTKATGTMASARVRPMSYGIPATVGNGGKTATFVLPRPMNVSFEADGDTLRNVHVFESPIERDVPEPGPRTMVFGPGMHAIPGDHILRVPSNTTVYIAAGAVVQGSIDIANARNVVIRGRGVVDPSPFFLEDTHPTIYVTRSTDVGVRDITLLRAQHAAVTIVESSRVAVSGLREITTDQSSDGFNIDASKDVLLDGLFLRTSDDSIAVNSSKWASRGHTRNITVRNSTLWADRAHAFLAGVHADPTRREVIEHLELQNIDVLEHDEFRGGDLYQGALALNAGDSVTVRDVRFDDVRIEDFSQGQVLNVKVFKNPAYNDTPGTRIEGVLFRNVTYAGAGDATSRIYGYDNARRVVNVTVENLVRNGATVLDASAGNIEVGPHTTNILFRRQPSTTTVGDASKGIRYSGRWRERESAASHAGDVHSPLRPGSTMSYSFRGRQARVYGLTGPAAGRVDVLVDGASVATVDTYSAVHRTQQIWFDTGVLRRRTPHRRPPAQGHEERARDRRRDLVRQARDREVARRAVSPVTRSQYPVQGIAVAGGRSDPNCASLSRGTRDAIPVLQTPPGPDGFSRPPLSWRCCPRRSSSAHPRRQARRVRPRAAHRGCRPSERARSGTRM